MATVAAGVGISFAAGAAVVAAGVGLAATVAGTIAQQRARKKAAQQQQQANIFQQRAARKNQQIAEAKNFQARLQQVRNARLRSAQVQQFAANAGASQTTSAVAASSIPFTQAGANIGFLNQQEGLAIERNQLLSTSAGFSNNAIASSNRAATFGAIANTGASVFQAAGGFSAFSSKPLTNTQAFNANSTQGATAF